MWRIQPVDAVSFRPVMAPLDASAVSWERVLNGVGRASFTVQTKASNIGWHSSWWRDLDTATKTILVLEWVGDDGVRTPMYAGWVMNRTAWDPRSGVATWETLDIRSWLSSRFLWPASYRGAAWYGMPVDLRSGTIEEACAGLVKLALGENRLDIGGVEVARWDRATTPRYSMPVTFSVVSGTPIPETMLIPARERYAEETLLELQGRDDGPDIDFVPGWANDGSLSFRCLVQAPELVRNTVKLSADLAPGAKTDLLDIGIVTDGLMTATSITGVGAGQGSDMLTATVYESDVRGGRTDIPQRERKFDAKRAEDPAQLRAESRGALARYRVAAKAWSFNVICGEAVQVTDFVPGTRVVIDYPGDLLESAALKTFVVTSVAGDLSQTLRLTVQEAV